MSTLNNNKRLDNSSRIGQDNPNEAMQPASETKKTPWHLRFAPGAILRKNGLIAVLAAAAVLTQAPVEKAGAWIIMDENGNVRSGPTPPAPVSIPLTLGSTNSVSTNSPPATYQPQDGDKIAYVTTRAWGKLPIMDFIKKIVRRLTGNVAGSVAGNVIYDASKGAWVNSPSAQAPSGQVWARAVIGISGVSGEQAYWYSTTGKPISRTLIDAGNYVSESKERDYYYYHFSYYKLEWDADNEIWKKKPNSSRNKFGTNTRYSIDRINSRYNQGEHGWEYPEHEDYRRGKRGYVIVYGTAKRIDLKHEFRSTIGVPIDNKLKNRAPKYQKDKFKPKVFAYLSDMTYTSTGWKYKNRTRPKEVKKELSAIVADSVDLGDDYLPFLTRLESEDYEDNESLIYWTIVETSHTPDGPVELDNGHELENLSVPIQYEVPEQQITDFN